MTGQLWAPQKIEESRLRWLLILRLITSAFLSLTITLIYINGRAPAIFDYWTRAISVVLIVSYLLAFLHYYVLPRHFSPGFQIIIQMFCDAFLAATIIVLTGGIESTLNFVFVVVVINSAFLGGLRMSFVAATLSTAAWATISDLHYFGYLPGLPPLVDYMGTTELVITILINTGASYLVAILSGHLSTQLILSSQALVTSQTSLDRLSQLNESIIHSIDSGLITTDTQGLILTVNPAGRDILRVSTNAVVGKHWRHLFPGLVKLDDQRLSDDEIQQYHQIRGLRFKHVRNGDMAELNIELSILALNDVRNENWGRLFVIKDQTALMQMEAEMKRSEHMAAVGQLAAGLAHEIRTPLASMSGSWHMLLSQTMKPEDQNRLMSIIGREMERLETLVGDFLSFAKPTAGNPQPVELNDLIEDQVHIFSSWKGDEAAIQVELDDIPKVFFDYSQLSQVIFNLVQNAMEAAVTTRHPHVSITSKVDLLRPGYVSLAISDNGSGISEENIRRIFEPFFTTKPDGNGLGLAMVWGIIMRGNGHISVSSTPDILTTFTVLLPIAPGEENL
ncbi:MAG: PAS domain-containing protein [Deltaproteobacteria bacterium]|jgi:two-component system sensor histidine kinase PilS (NtrC family)|nr:PAS domain-containing protein [Deltaproteobacteria bacterium]